MRQLIERLERLVESEDKSPFSSMKNGSNAAQRAHDLYVDAKNEVDGALATIKGDPSMWMGASREAESALSDLVDYCRQYEDDLGMIGFGLANTVSDIVDDLDRAQDGKKVASALRRFPKPSFKG